MVTRPGLALAVGEPAINPAPRRLIRELVADDRARPGRRRRPRGHDLDPRRRDPGAAHRQRPPRHRRRPLDPRHHRRRDPLFLRVLDPLDPPRHRRRARRRPRPRRRRHRLDLGARGAGALRPARVRADRHGRLRRRHAQVSAPPPDRAGHAGRRLRQARQARGRPSRPALEPLRRSTCRRSPSCSPSAAPPASWSRMRAMPARPGGCCELAQGMGLPLADDVALRGAPGRARRARRRLRARGDDLRPRRRADRPRQGW